MDLKEIGCEVERWAEVSQNRVHWRPLVLAILDPRVLLPQSQSVSQSVRCHYIHVGCFTYSS